MGGLLLNEGVRLLRIICLYSVNIIQLVATNSIKEWSKIMTIDDIKNICVVGAGNMGHQISLLCAIHGYKTTCTDVIPEILKKAEKFADTY